MATRAADETILYRLCDSGLVTAALAPRARSWSVSDMRAKGNKYIVFGQLTEAGRDATEAVQPHEVVAKVYRSSGGGHGAHAVLTELWESGFREPSQYRVPRSYGYVDELRALFQQRVRGASWADCLANPGAGLEPASWLAAEWLLALQARPVGDAKASTTAEQIAQIEKCVPVLAADFPEHAARIGQLGRVVVTRLAEDRSLAVNAHGDYHPINVSVSGGQVTVIDFDAYGPRTPAFDVGYCIGQLLMMSDLKLGSWGPGAAAGRTFWSRYAREGVAEWRHVATQVAWTLVFCLHYQLCAFRTGRADLIRPWLAGAEAWLGASGPEIFDAPFGAAERSN